MTEFSDAKGLGTVTGDDGRSYLFHVVEIADGTRTVDIGQPVVFHPLPKIGVVEAGRLLKV